MFAQRIKELRKEMNLTQADFAAVFNIATGTIGMWETGKRQPDYDTLKKLSDFFNVSTDYLLGKTDDKTDADISFDDFTYAMYNESKELTDDQKDMLLSMAKTFRDKLKKDGKI